jgi:alpha-L-fucosidase 2
MIWPGKRPLSGRLVAMVFGGVRRERVALNHEWLWRGRHRQRDTADGDAQLPEVRRLLLAERWEEAAKLANEAFGGSGGIRRADGCHSSSSAAALPPGMRDR